MKRFLRWSICLILAVSSRSAEAATDWLKVQGSNYTILGNVDAGRISAFAASVDAFMAALREPFPEVRFPRNLTVVVFRDNVSYDPFRPEREGVVTQAPGYFLAGQDVDFISLADGPQAGRVLHHELFHAAARVGNRTAYPPWASEGLAEYYSTLDSGFGAIIPGHVLTLKQRSWIPLADLISASPSSPFLAGEDIRDVFYAESWALIHYLISQGVSDPVEEALRQDRLQLAANLRTYISALLVTVAVENDPQSVMMRTAEPVSESETATVLGSLLLQLGRTTAAGEQFERALQATPVSAKAFTAMGILRLREGRNGDALAQLRLAVEQDAADYRAHFYYAVALQALSAEERRDPRFAKLELSRVHLKRAIELAPWFSEAYNWLGYVAIALEDRFQESQALLERARSADPGNVELGRTLARVHAAYAAHLESDAIRFDREKRRRTAMLGNTLRGPSPDLSVQPPPPPVAPPAVRRVVYPTLEGQLTMIDCRQGLTLVVRANDQIVKFTTRTPIKVEFTSKVSNAANEAACGYVRPEAHVVVTYRKTGAAGVLGEPIRIEYK